MAGASSRPRLQAHPLRGGEFGVLGRALAKAGLPRDDLEQPGRLFFRFERDDDMAVGFGGFEIYGEHALLRSVVTLPPLRAQGYGAAIVAGLENEALFRGCRNVWVMTGEADGFFERLGYAPRAHADVPADIRARAPLQVHDAARRVALMKRMD